MSKPIRVGESPGPRSVEAAVADPKRLAALRWLGIIDTPPDPQFDQLTRLAAKVLNVPVSAISLVDAHRQVFKSATGLGEPWATLRETPLSHSFCQHAVARRQPLIVPNARLDPILCDNPAIDDLGVVAYAGVPLVTQEGFAIGTFCVVDHRPRAWTAAELELLDNLAAAALAIIAEREIRLRTIDSLEDGFIALNRAWRYAYLNRRAAELLGRATEDLIGTTPSAEFPLCPGRPIYDACQRAVAENHAVLHEEFVPASDRWYENRIYPVPEGLWIFFRDITERKRAQADLIASRDELRTLARHLESVRDEERRRVGRQIHDHLGQGLTLLRLEIMKCVREVTRFGLPEPSGIQEVLRHVEHLLEATRNIAAEVHPPLLEDLGLGAAVQWLGERVTHASEVVVDVQIAPIELSQPQRFALYAIVQEALTNVVRHAAARRAWVGLEPGPGKITLTIQDDGRGVDRAPGREDSLGIIGMRERASALGGTFRLENPPEGGTAVKVDIPMTEVGS